MKPKPNLTDPSLVRLTALVHHRWTLPVLGELYRDDGAKFVTLVHRLSISRDSLVRTLEYLQTLNLAVKNPGYGHPLRPEYVLTPIGQVIGSSTLELLQHIRQFGILEPMLKKWSLPVLLGVHHDLDRFTDLLAALPNVTSRALSLAVRDLENANILKRENNTYRLTKHGSRLAELLEPLTRSLPEMP
jgi:DNA-binding HxlR family transcriptional regulator